MSHGLGITDAFRGAPDAAIVFFTLVTQLGDVWFYVVALTVGYAFANELPGVGDALTRERVAFVIAVALGVTALVGGLKELFVHPRPPSSGTARELAWLPEVLVPFWENAATGDGYSFPSGHATGSAAIYGAAALTIDYGRRRRRYAAAVLTVVLIASSRVVIGVHYLGDVLVGILVGGAYLALVWQFADGERVKRAFSLAVLVAALAAVVSFSFATLSSLGGALGGRLTWSLVDGRVIEAVSRTEGAVATLLALAVGGGLVAASYVVHTPVVGFLANGVAIGAIFVAPLVARLLVD